MLIRRYCGLRGDRPVMKEPHMPHCNMLRDLGLPCNCGADRPEHKHKYTCVIQAEIILDDDGELWAEDRKYIYKCRCGDIYVETTKGEYE